MKYIQYNVYAQLQKLCNMHADPMHALSHHELALETGTIPTLVIMLSCFT